MYASQLRACGLGAVVAVLLGAVIGVGWHYFGDSAGSGASRVALPEKQDVPDLLSSNPHAQPEDPVIDLSRARGMAIELSDEQKLALVTLLTRIIANDRYPSSPYVRTLRDILSKLDPKPPAQLSLAPKAHALPEETRTRSLHQG